MPIWLWVLFCYNADMMKSGLFRKHIVITAVTHCLLCFTLIFSELAYADVDPWPFLREQTFQSRSINDSNPYVKLYTPQQVPDAAQVPVSIRLSPELISNLKKLYLIIDRNPDPYAMEINFFDGFRDAKTFNEHAIYTRVRVNDFSTIRAIAETMDNHLFMSTSYVSGSGGCSAPSASSNKDILANMGNIKVKTIKDTNMSDNWHQIGIRIQHPNYTGMQMSGTDDNSLIPAKYIKDITVNYDQTPLMLIQSGITISENPSFRFNLISDGDGKINIEAIDSDGAVYKY